MKYNHKKELESKSIVAEMAATRLARTQQVNEGPWSQIGKGALGALKNPLNIVKGAKQGYQQQAGVDANEAEINEVLTQWHQIAGQIGAAGAVPTSQQFNQFLARQLPDANAQVPPKFDVNDPQILHDIVSKAVHQQSINSQLGQPEAPGSQPGTPAAPVPAGAQPANVDVGTSAPVGKAAAATPAAPVGKAADAYQQIRKLLPQLRDPSQIQKLVKTLTSMSASATPPAATPPASAPAMPAAQPPASAPAMPAAQPPASDPAVIADITSALTNMGYTKQDAQAKAAALPPGTTTEEGLRQIISGQPAAPATQTAGKINNKPSIAEARALKKLQANLIVKEMAVRKAKRDKGIK